MMDLRVIRQTRLAARWTLVHMLPCDIARSGILLLVCADSFWKSRGCSSLPSTCQALCGADRCTGPAPGWWVGDLDQDMQGRAFRKRTPSIFQPRPWSYSPPEGLHRAGRMPHCGVWPEAGRCPFLVVQVCQLVKGHPRFACRSRVGWQQI